MKSAYTTTYEPQVICGESGFAYRCMVGGRFVFEGWSRGSKRDAEAEVRQGINAREAIVSAVSL